MMFKTKFVLSAALIFVCLIAIIPFASRIHYLPLPQWFGEINVVWLIVLSALCLLVSRRLFDQWPNLSTVCVLAAILWVLQPYVVPVLFPGLNGVTALAWLTAALLVSIVYSLRNGLGDRYFAQSLAWALLIGTLIQSLIGLAQILNIASFFGLFYDGLHPDTNIFGHIGQRNQYAHYLMWGMVAGCYLFSIGLLAKRWLVVWVVWISFILAYAASRTVLLYLVALVIITLFWYWRMRVPESAKMWRAILFMAVVVACVQMAYPIFSHWITLLTHVEVSSGLERLIDNSGSDTRRFTEMHKAWLVFKAHPLWGVGWMQFAAQSVQLQTWPQFAHAGFNSGLFTHSHNLITQLLAEMGGVITVLLALGMVWVIWPFFSRSAQIEGTLALGCLAVTLIHSLLEYPLWYYYFFAMMIVFLAMAPRTIPYNPIALWKRIPAFICLVAIAWLSISSFFTFWRLVGVYQPTDDATIDVQHVQWLEKVIQTQPLFAYHALYTLDDYIRPENIADLSKNIALEKKFTAFRPYPYSMLKLAKMQILQGHQKQAEQTLETTLASFPTYAKSFIPLLRNDVRWGPLLRLTQERYANLPKRYQ